MFTLTGTCAEIEDDENVPTKKGQTDKSIEENKESEAASKGSKDDGASGKDDGQTTDEAPPSIKGKKLSKDASTETDGGDATELQDAKDGDAVEEEAMAGGII